MFGVDLDGYKLFYFLLLFMIFDDFCVCFKIWVENGGMFIFGLMIGYWMEYWIFFIDYVMGEIVEWFGIEVDSCILVGIKLCFVEIFLKMAYNGFLDLLEG